ncbi:MAG: signal peptidase II, partial [Clostridia bacterium]|nr:signal peptidase II [Clostridia bacterium]
NFFFKKKNVLYSISLGMILSGAICNLLDRITFGYVRDFIKLDFINFPIFNIADSAICVGVFLFCIFFIFYVQKKESK